MPKLASPIPYHGGKYYLADWIISKFPPKGTFNRLVDAYFGGGSVLLAFQDYDGVAEVANDIDRRLTNFWRVLQQPASFAQFNRMIEAMPVSQVEFNSADRRIATPNIVESAVGLFIQVRQSHQKVVGAKTFMHPTNRIRRGMHESASRWLSAIGGLEFVHHRLQRVVIYNKDALDLIRQEDSPTALFYLDPPYRGPSREGGLKYGIECDDKHHLELLRLLGTIKGKFLLSGYMNKMYVQAAEHYGWYARCRTVTKHSSGVEGERPKAEEYLWTNYQPPEKD